MSKPGACEASGSFCFPEDLKLMVDFILQKDYEVRPSMEDIITSNSFQYNALRLGLDNDLKDVLGIKELPINSMKNLMKQFIKKPLD